MAKRELIDKKAFIDRSAIEFVSLKDSFRYMEWSKNNEVQLEMIATTTTEQEIVKPYLDKLTAKIHRLRGCSCSHSDAVIDDIEAIIDNLLSEQEVVKQWT